LKNGAPWSSQKRAFWKKKEKALMVCFYCSKEVRRDVGFDAANRATIDHMVPKSKGGKDTKTNWIVSCYPCNQQKMDK
jgi:5-methylcytosine-specific restriction endonuclease McrA